jgi:uvrABC system protein C
VHRYAISFHRDKRSKTQLHSELDDIKGIGPKTKDALLKKLKIVKHIKEADLQELTEVIGASKATIVYNYFHANQ